MHFSWRLYSSEAFRQARFVRSSRAKSSDGLPSSLSPEEIAGVPADSAIAAVESATITASDG